MTAEPDDRIFRCPNCGGTEYEPGFVDDTMAGRVRWLVGPFRRGPLGNARGRSTRPNRPVIAHRCVGCSRLELYAIEPRPQR